MVPKIQNAAARQSDAMKIKITYPYILEVFKRMALCCAASLFGYLLCEAGLQVGFFTEQYLFAGYIFGIIFAVAFVTFHLWVFMLPIFSYFYFFKHNTIGYFWGYYYCLPSFLICLWFHSSEIWRT